MLASIFFPVLSEVGLSPSLLNAKDMRRIRGRSEWVRGALIIRTHGVMSTDLSKMITHCDSFCSHCLYISGLFSKGGQTAAKRKKNPDKMSRAANVWNSRHCKDSHVYLIDLLLYWRRHHEVCFDSGTTNMRVLFTIMNDSNSNEKHHWIYLVMYLCISPAMWCPCDIQGDAQWIHLHVEARDCALVYCSGTTCCCLLGLIFFFFSKQILTRYYDLHIHSNETPSQTEDHQNLHADNICRARETTYHKSSCPVSLYSHASTHVRRLKQN